MQKNPWLHIYCLLIKIFSFRHLYPFNIPIFEMKLCYMMQNLDTLRYISISFTTVCRMSVHCLTQYRPMFICPVRCSLCLCERDLTYLKSLVWGALREGPWRVWALVVLVNWLFLVSDVDRTLTHPLCFYFVLKFRSTYISALC